MKALLSFCLLSAFLSASFAATPQFSSRKDIATGFQRLGGIAVADFNADGRPDIAAVDMYGIRLAVYLNNGNGSFAAPVFTALTLPYGVPSNIVAADFDEDGKADVLIPPYSGMQPALYLRGKGDGTFTQQADLSGDKGFVAATAVDINRDAHLDLLTAGNYAGAFLGDGRGNLQAQALPDQATLRVYSSIAAADVNNDGKLDFAAASFGVPPNIRVYIGNGDGTFSPPSVQPWPAASPADFVSTGSLGFADFNNDGKSDLLYSHRFNNYLSLGDGSGTFDLTKASRLPSTNTNVSVTVGSNNIVVSPYVRATDLNGDKMPDVVAANKYSNSLAILTNDGTGAFPDVLADLSQPIDIGTSSLDTSDLNGDGLPDIVLGNNTTQNISIYFSIRPKTTPSPTLTSSSAPAFVSHAVTFTAKVAGINNISPTGAITLMDGSSSLGQQMLDANGQAIFTLSNLTAGQHMLTAAYAGDLNYNPATSAAVTQAITDMQLAFTAASQTVVAGGTASYPLTVTPAGGLTGSVTLSCSQLPSLATCDPVSVSLAGQPITANLTIRTTAPVRSRETNSKFALLVAPLLAAFYCSKRRSLVTLGTIALAVAIGISSGGCSSGGTSASMTPVTVTPGTPAGSTSFTVTATTISGSQTLTRTSTATLIVQ